MDSICNSFEIYANLMDEYCFFFSLSLRSIRCNMKYIYNDDDNQMYLLLKRI